MLASARGTFQKVPGMHGFLLGDFILSYHKQETILCPVYPHYGNLNKNRRTGTQKPATASPRNMKRHPKGFIWDIFRWAVTVMQVYMPSRRLMEALYSLNSPPVVSFKFRVPAILGLPTPEASNAEVSPRSPMLQAPQDPRPKPQTPKPANLLSPKPPSPKP